MEVNNQDLSLSLYNYLCMIVGSEDVVRTRRRIFNAVDYVNCRNKYTYISSGSKAEGLDLDGSDYDVIFVDNLMPVYENIDDFTGTPTRPGTLLINTNDTKPGYARLRRLTMNHRHRDIDYMYTTFVSNKSFLELNQMDGFVIHGPCKSIPSSLFDSVLGLRCKKWISQADAWTHRSRSSWPNNRLIETVVQNGVLFVPIGCKNSPAEEFEFRISFNVAEKILVHSFSHVQILCYALLKIILKHFLKPQYGELLCSYFIKTIMFWVSEETEESTWKPRNLLRCFDRCFKRLVYCVTYSTCLHYFIPELNLFEERFSKSEHEALTSTLQRLYNSGWQFVLQTDLLRSFIYSTVPSPTRTELSVSALPIAVYITISPNISFYRSIFGALNLPGKQFYASLLSKVNQRHAQIAPIHETYNGTNKQKYRHYRTCLSQLLQGLHREAVAGWLLLASFFYRFHQYRQCLHILKYCLHKCTPDKILLSLTIDKELQHEFNIEMKQHIRNSFLRSSKRRVIDYVLFEKKSCIIPKELSSTVVEQIAFFPPVVFAHFLHCICLHRLNIKTEKMNALRDLETTVQELYFIFCNEYSIDLSMKCIQEARKLFSASETQYKCEQ